MSFDLNPMSAARIATQATSALEHGGALKALQAGSQVFSSIGQNVIQAVGQKLGLPQSSIDLAKATFCASSGDVFGAGMNTQAAVSDFVQEAGGGGSDEQQLNDVSQMVTRQLEKMATDAASGEDNSDSAAAKAKNGGAATGQDFLEALAQALGKAIDDKMGQMMQTAKDIDAQTQSANDSGGTKQPVIAEMSAKVQALGQEISLLSSALDNSIKSIGEASSTLAKKN